MRIAGLDFTSNPFVDVTNSKKNTIITSKILDNKIIGKKITSF